MITDPGSALGASARERGFRHVWENEPDIGGRYSALSLFGVAPAALIDADGDGGGSKGSSDPLAQVLAGHPAYAVTAG